MRTTSSTRYVPTMRIGRSLTARSRKEVAASVAASAQWEILESDDERTALGEAGQQVEERLMEARLGQELL